MSFSAVPLVLFSIRCTSFFGTGPFLFSTYPSFYQLFLLPTLFITICMVLQVNLVCYYWYQILLRWWCINKISIGFERHSIYFEFGRCFNVSGKPASHFGHEIFGPQTLRPILFGQNLTLANLNWAVNIWASLLLAMHTLVNDTLAFLIWANISLWLLSFWPSMIGLLSLWPN